MGGGCLGRERQDVSPFRVVLLLPMLWEHVSQCGHGGVLLDSSGNRILENKIAMLGTHMKSRFVWGVGIVTEINMMQRRNGNNGQLTVNPRKRWANAGGRDNVLKSKDSLT